LRNAAEEQKKLLEWVGYFFPDPLITHDDINLDAEYFSHGKPDPGILLLSMCDPATDKSEWQNVALLLQKEGFHVLIFDYRGFGESEGSKPDMMGTMDEAMKFWRTNWIKDVEKAYDFLIKQKGVNKELMGIGGVSCGVFMGLEFALNLDNIKTFVSLGGPIDNIQQEKLKSKVDFPILIISANEGPSLQWSDEVFNASNSVETKITKYKIVTHGTKIFDYKPNIQKQIV